MAIMEVISIDAQIAAVLEQTKVSECPLRDPTCPGKYEPQIGRWPCLPPYSTDIEAAILAAEQYGLFSDEKTGGYGYWLGKEFGLWVIAQSDYDPPVRITEPSDSPALAICLGILKLEEWRLYREEANRANEGAKAKLSFFRDM